MKLLDLTLPSPAENLACDEALLDWCETGAGQEVLRFWESSRYFVAVGYADKVRRETNLPACEAKGVPIYRRCSGGGTVLQGPGCLNYALVLRITNAAPFHTIASTNRFILDQHCSALDSFFAGFVNGKQRGRIIVRGHTDLCLGNLKFSGNSQRRRKHFLLFHGTVLLNFDLRLVAELLPMPSRQPIYRDDRVHEDFLTNLNVPVEAAKTALQKAWNIAGILKNPPLQAIATLACEKYSSASWNLKF